jgi:hypothetical protein
MSSGAPADCLAAGERRPPVSWSDDRHRLGGPATTAWLLTCHTASSKTSASPQAPRADPQRHRLVLATPAARWRSERTRARSDEPRSCHSSWSSPSGARGTTRNTTSPPRRCSACAATSCSAVESMTCGSRPLLAHRGHSVRHRIAPRTLCVTTRRPGDSIPHDSQRCPRGQWSVRQELPTMKRNRTRDCHHLRHLHEL